MFVRYSDYFVTKSSDCARSTDYLYCSEYLEQPSSFSLFSFPFFFPLISSFFFFSTSLLFTPPPLPSSSSPPHPILLLPSSLSSLIAITQAPSQPTVLMCGHTLQTKTPLCSTLTYPNTSPTGV